MNVMQWEKFGIVFAPQNCLAWSEHSALQPTAIFLEHLQVIRVFFGSRDSQGVSRIGFVDLDPSDPRKILEYSETPCFDIGEDGNFDDNGVVPCCAVMHEGKLLLYYAGYQIVGKVRFLVFSGLAESNDDGRTFTRVQKTPVSERNNNETLFRVIHTALNEQGKWKFWYGGGSHFITENNHTYPCYDIRYIESARCDVVGPQGVTLLQTGGHEYRIARPNVIKFKNKYHMFLCHGSVNDAYSLGYAHSDDGVTWSRNDQTLNLTKSKNGWDSDMMAYPNFIIVNNEAYLFYNGNEYGKNGFGCAKLLSLNTL